MSDARRSKPALAVSLGLSGKEALRLAMPPGALNVTRHGRGTGELGDTRVLTNCVEIRKVLS